MLRPFEATRGALQLAAVSAVATTAAIFTAGGRRSGARDGVSAAGEPGCPVGMIRVPHPVFAGRPLGGDRSILQTLRGVIPTSVFPRPVNGPLWPRSVNAPARRNGKDRSAVDLGTHGDRARYPRGGAGACAGTLRRQAMRWSCSGGAA